MVPRDPYRILYSSIKRERYIAARALAPQAVGRPSKYLHVNDVIQPAPKFQSGNGDPKPAKRKIGKAKRPMRKKQKRVGKIRDEKPKGASPLLKFGFRQKV